MSDWSDNVYDAYNNMLDDSNPMVTIDNLEYMPSEVLRWVDPVAYRCKLNDYLDSLARDGIFCFKCAGFECSCEEE